MSVEEIPQELMKDEELTQVRDCIQGNRCYQLPQSYKLIADDRKLCVNNDGIVLRGSRIVLPVKLRKHAIEIANEDHAGMTKCKQRIRSKLWWPQMDKNIEVT